MEVENVFALVDADSFYANCESLRRGLKEVIVCNREREVVLSATYRLKKAGVKSGLPLSRFSHLFGVVKVVPAEFDYYAECSARIEGICSARSRGLRRLSIDEWLVLPLSHFGEELKWASDLQREIFAKTGLTVSIGLSRVPALSKLASEFAKPSGVLSLLPAGEERFKSAWKERIRNYEVFLDSAGRRKSFSVSNTFRKRTYISSVFPCAIRMLYELYGKSLSKGFFVEGVGVSLRFADDFSSRSAQEGVSVPLSLFKAKRILCEKLTALAHPSRPIRSVRVFVRVSYYGNTVEGSTSHRPQDGFSICPLCCL